MSEARDKILQAAVAEFGEHGYEKASTNHIMENAGVSKGLIFHYFGCKTALYTACVRYVMEIYLEGYSQIHILAERDCLKRLEAAISYKMQFFIENPAWGKLLLDATKLWENAEIPELTEYLDQGKGHLYELLHSDLDMAKYKKNIEQDKITEFILLVIEAYANRYQYEQMSYDELIGLMDDYAHNMEIVKEMIRYGVYEQEQHA